jgi:hypothetical protein
MLPRWHTMGRVFMSLNARQVEFFQLGLLLFAVLLFYLIVIPVGVADPEGYGMDEGLPPSFSPRLVAWLAAGLMVGRFLQLALRGADPVGCEGAANAAETDTDNEGFDGQDSGALSMRAITGVVIALIYSLGLVPYLGFIISSGLLMPALLLAMGERRIVPLTVYPAIVVLAVWLLFEQLLAIRLPPATLFAS